MCSYRANINDSRNINFVVACFELYFRKNFVKAPKDGKEDYFLQFSPCEIHFRRAFFG